jgi:hypothetical protein
MFRTPYRGASAVYASDKTISSDSDLGQVLEIYHERKTSEKPGKGGFPEVSC